MDNPRVPDTAMYQYSNSGMVPTDDNFVERLRGYNSSMPAMTQGETHSIMPLWSIVLLFIGVTLVFIIWFLYASFCAYTSSQVSQTLSSNQQDENENNKPLSRTRRKNMIMEYFENSGNQMEVQAVDLLYLADEEGMVLEDGEDPHQFLDNAKSIVADDGPGSILVLLVDRSKAPLAPESYYPSAPDDDNDEELGICSTSAKSEPQESLHESLSSAFASTPQSQDEDGVSLESFSISCTNSNHFKNVSTTSSPLHTGMKLLQSVYDNCAICMEPYQEGDVVVWSCTDSCPHVFHKTCFVDYLLSYRGPGTPCPSCRQPFIDECVCTSCKNRPKRNTLAAETSTQTPIANESTVESVNTVTIDQQMNQDDGRFTT